jgi:hypothetical protein
LLHTGETFSDYQNLHAILAGGSFYSSESRMKANQARIHGDRIFAISGVSTSLGGFMKYDESDSKFIVIRIAQIQRKPLRIMGNICIAVGHAFERFPFVHCGHTFFYKASQNPSMNTRNHRCTCSKERIFCY